MKCPKCNFDNPADTKFCGNCAAALKPSEEISPSHTKTLETPKEEFGRGTTFAERYDFIEELGTGGMGSVYKVFDKKIKEEVALKIMYARCMTSMKKKAPITSPWSMFLVRI
jgi:hypothetical protein